MTTFTVDPKNYPTPLELAEAGYRGYAEKTGGKTFDGRDMPEWKDLPERTIQAWVAAVVAIQAETARGTVYLSQPNHPVAPPIAQMQNFTVAGGQVHGGADCWCGPTVTEAGIGHRCNLGEVHELPGEPEST